MGRYTWCEYCPICDWHKEVNPRGGALHAPCPGCGHQDLTWNTYLGDVPEESKSLVISDAIQSDFLRIEAVKHRQAFPLHLCTTCIDPRDDATDLFLFSDQYSPSDLGLGFTTPSGKKRFCWFEARHIELVALRFRDNIAFCDKNNSPLADTIIRYYIWLDIIDEEHDYYDDDLAKDVDKALAEEK